MNGTEVKKNTPELINYPAFSKEIEYIYNALAGDAGTDDRMDDNRDIFLGCGMLEWLYIFNIKQPGPGVSGKVFRMKPVADTAQDELVILFANMMGGRDHGIL